MKLNKKAFGLSAGILLGLAILIITNFLFFIRGTEGKTIIILKNFCFGYNFSFWGSLIGLIWGLIYGFITGCLFAFFYNLFVRASRD